jgi:hypothetical protein
MHGANQPLAETSETISQKSISLSCIVRYSVTAIISLVDIEKRHKRNRVV